MTSRLSILLLLVLVLAGCVSSGKREARSQKPELQTAIRDKYFFHAADPARLYSQPSPHRATLVVVPAGFTRSLAWRETDSFNGWRIWESVDLQQWQIVAAGTRPLTGFDFTNTFTSVQPSAFYRVEVWR